MRTVSLMLVLLLCSCGGGGGAEASSSDGGALTVSVRKVNGPDALTKDEAAEVLALFQQDVELEIGAVVQFISFEEIDLPGVLGVEGIEVESQQARLDLALDYQDAHPCKAKFCYYMLPPVSVGSVRFIGGMGQVGRGCYAGDVAVGQAEAWSSHSVPRSRIFASAVIMRHEWAHGWGAQHLNVSEGYPVNVMDQAANQYSDERPEDLVFLEQSKDVIKSCGGWLPKVATRHSRRCAWLRKQGRKKQAKRCEAIGEAPHFLSADAPAFDPASE